MKKLISGLTAAALSCLCATFAIADTTIHVTLSDMGGTLDFSKPQDLGMGGHGDRSHPMVMLMADKTSVPAGKVTFAVVNQSKETQHEMILMPLDVDKPGIKFVSSENRVDEDEPGSLGEVSELDPGKTGNLTRTLEPGNYLLFCNIPGHYDAGMWTKIKVE
jgi:uncharacterized cupredoxin-like copper-binding protein